MDDKYGNVANFPVDKLRTFVLAVFQHQTFCRFSDVAKITLADVFHDVDYFKVHIRMSKTDQGGDGQWVLVPKSDSPFRNAHMLLCLYIHRMGFDSTDPTVSMYLFPPLKWSTVRHEYCVVPNRPLSYSHAYKNFKTLLSFSSLDPRMYAMHSPRRGGTTEAFQSGVPDHIIDIQGRWKSSSTKYRYLKLSDRELAFELARKVRHWVVYFSFLVDSHCIFYIRHYSAIYAYVLLSLVSIFSLFAKALWAVSVF